jgi:calcineurin-like phosphoesterase family protein
MSGIIRVCADTHFGHNNMAIKRGFNDSFYHDEYIVDHWNRNINKRDVTYILGDVTMEKRTNYDILDRLNGMKIVVLGNHDDKNHVRSLLEHVDHVAGCVKLRVNGKSVFLTHVPVHPMEFDYRLDYNIHGHIHDLKVKNQHGRIWKDDSRYICVSMEQIKYIPKELNLLIN